MQVRQFENDNFVLYSPDSLNYITSDLENILTNSLEVYKMIFDVTNFRKVQINYFDDIDEFRKYIYDIRGEEESLPEYAKGTYDNGMINAYIEPDINENTPLYTRRKYNASHELFHVMYQELVLDKNNQNRIVWFDEGMAQFFSGEYYNEMTAGFNEWFNEVRNNTKTIPNLNELDHGKGFKTEDYNGYDLSLLVVKYLIDELGMDEFKELIKDNKRILNYGNTIIENAFDYYAKDDNKRLLK